MQQHPALGVENFLQGEIGAVALIHRSHQFFAHIWKGGFAAEIIVYHSGGAAGVGINNQLSVGFLGFEAVYLRFVVVKGHAHPGIIRQVGGNIVIG